MPNVRVFPCPKCGEFIATDTRQCRFCSTPIFPAGAQIAADAQDKENKRYMRRRYFRHMLIGAGVFILGAALTIALLVPVYYSPDETPVAVMRFSVITIVVALYGAGDFLYGLAGVFGMIK